METAETEPEQDGLRDKIAAAYAPYVALCRLLEHRLREEPEDHPPVGWAPYLEALRALRDGRVAGDWDRLAELMVDPAALPEPAAPSPDPVTAAAETPHACLIDVPDPARHEATLRALVERLAAAGRQILLLAPDEAARAAATQTLAAIPALFHAEALPEALSEALPEATADVAGPVSGGSGGGPDATRASAAGGTGAERVVRAAVLQAAGTGFARAWQAQTRELQRGLLWLEQWPRDRATLAAVHAEAEEAGRLRAERERRAAQAVVAATETVEMARQRAAAAREEVERLTAELREADELATGLRAELRDRQADADTAGQTAAATTAAAEESRGRLAALTETQTRSERDLNAAREREAFLQVELPRARQALPEASAEAARLMEGTTAANAEGRASYYRLAAAESALAAEKRQQSIGQRLRVVPARPETQDLRRQVAQRRREADEAARGARQARETYEKAEAYRSAVAEVIASGEQELIATREAQERLGADLVRLAEEVSVARSEHEQCAGLAATAVDRATEAAAIARQAGAVSHQADERATAARGAYDGARLEAEAADTAIAAATQALAGAQGAAEREEADAVAAAERERIEIDAAEKAEAGSRLHVAEFCATDDLDDAALAAHRDRAMAGIEQLTAAPSAETLLAQAAAVCTTPLALAACPPLHDAVFDTLIVTDAGLLTDGEFLLGAVRARHWILLGDIRARPRPVDADYTAHLLSLAALSRAEPRTPPGENVPGHDILPAPAQEAAASAQPPAGQDAGQDAGQEDGTAQPEPADAPQPAAVTVVQPAPTWTAAPAAEADAPAADGPADPGSHPAGRAETGGTWRSAAGRADEGRSGTTEFAVSAIQRAVAGRTDVPDQRDAHDAAGEAAPERHGTPAAMPDERPTATEPQAEPPAEPLAEPAQAQAQPPAKPPAEAAQERPQAQAPDMTVVDLPVSAHSAGRRLEVAAGIVAARWAGTSEAAVLAQARRIQAAGLWESRYRDGYAKVLARLERDGDPDPEETLISTAAGGRSLFGRAALAAPALFHPAEV